MGKEAVILFPALAASVVKARSLPVNVTRGEELQVLIAYIRNKLESGGRVNLNFICTHNSRRSQFSQIWAQTAADFFGVPAQCYSGGVEVTAFNRRAVESIRRNGFEVTSIGIDNPIYFILHSEEAEPMHAFSKLYDDPVNKAVGFAAVMTCAHADENCPYIPGSEVRVPLCYEDPKSFDDTPEEAARYDERSLQIASEMFYVFSQVGNQG